MVAALIFTATGGDARRRIGSTVGSGPGAIYVDGSGPGGSAKESNSYGEVVQARGQPGAFCRGMVFDEGTWQIRLGAKPLQKRHLTEELIERGSVLSGHIAIRTQMDFVPARSAGAERKRCNGLRQGTRNRFRARPVEDYNDCMG